MERKRPTAVVVIAIFHFIFGACYLGSVGYQASGLDKQIAAMQQPDPKTKQLQEELQRKAEQAPGAEAMKYTGYGVNLLQSALLLVCGIGLLGMQPWARTGSIVYAVISIVFTIVTLIYAYTVQLPIMNEGLQEMVKDSPEAAKLMGPVMGATFACFGCLSIIYPIVVLIVMFTPSVTAAFRAQPQTTLHEEDYDSFERDRPPEG